MDLIIAIQLGLNTLLTIANLYYLYSFYKLEHKKFHLMMFGLLQVCFAMVIAACWIYTEYLKEQSNKALYYTGDGLWHISQILNNMVHSLFVIKLWVISRKLAQSIDNKAIVLLVAQLVSCALFELPTILYDNIVSIHQIAWMPFFANAVDSIPLFSIAFILIDSFLTMKT